MEDAADTRRQRLFRMASRPSGAVFPLGIIEVFKQSTAGLVVSVILSLTGILAFAIHGFFLARGRPEFRTLYSVLLLGAMLVLSLAQTMITLSLLI